MNELLRGAEVRLETTLGAHTFRLGELLDDSPPGPAMRLLQPRISVIYGGTVLATTSQQAPPDYAERIRLAFGILAVGAFAYAAAYAFR